MFMKTIKCLIKLCTILYNTVKDRSSQTDRKITQLFLFWPLLEEEIESNEIETSISNNQPDNETIPRQDLTLPLSQRDIINWPVSYETSELIKDANVQIMDISQAIDKSSRNRTELCKRLDDLDSRVSEIMNTTLVLPEHPTERDVQMLLRLANLIEQRICREHNATLLLSKEKKYIQSFVFAEKLVTTMEKINCDIQKYVHKHDQNEALSETDDLKLAGSEHAVKDENHPQNELQDQMESEDLPRNKNGDTNNECVQNNEWTPQLHYLSDSCGL